MQSASLQWDPLPLRTFFLISLCTMLGCAVDPQPVPPSAAQAQADAAAGGTALYADSGAQNTPGPQDGSTRVVDATSGSDGAAPMDGGDRDGASGDASADAPLDTLDDVVDAGVDAAGDA